MASTVTVRINTRGLDLLRRTMGKNVNRHPEVEAMLKRVGVRYLAAMSRRYVTYSRGGGDWQPLAESTIERRRQGSAAILVDTGMLIQALEPGNPGNVAKMDKGGFTVGFSSGSVHLSSTMTYAALAKIHSLGMGNMPARPILVAPPEQVMAMAKLDAEAAIERVLDDCAKVTGVNRGKRSKYPSMQGFSRVGGTGKKDGEKFLLGYSRRITTFGNTGKSSRSFLGSTSRAVGRGALGAARIGAKGVVGAARISAATRGIAPAAALIAGLGVVSLVNAGGGRRRGGGA